MSPAALTNDSFEPPHLVATRRKKTVGTISFELKALLFGVTLFQEGAKIVSSSGIRVPRDSSSSPDPAELRQP